MSSYQPAVLIEMINNEPTGGEIKGKAIISIPRNDHGSMEASDTFRSTDEWLQSPERLLSMLFLYKGFAFEKKTQYEIRAVMTVKISRDELYELKTSTEPVIVQQLNTTGKPVKLHRFT